MLFLVEAKKLSLSFLRRYFLRAGRHCTGTFCTPPPRDCLRLCWLTIRTHRVPFFADHAVSCMNHISVPFLLTLPFSGRCGCRPPSSHLSSILRFPLCATCTCCCCATVPHLVLHACILCLQPARKRKQESCTNLSSHGVVGTNRALLWGQHAQDGVIDVTNRPCARTRGAPSTRSYGRAGTNKRHFCCTHASAGMVRVNNKRCGHPGCDKRQAVLVRRGGDQEARVLRAARGAGHDPRRQPEVRQGGLRHEALLRGG